MKFVQILSFLVFASGCLTQTAIIELPPIPPIGLTVSPASPGSDTSPTVTGQTSPSVSLILYSGPGCSGYAVSTGQASTSGSFSLTSGILPSGTYNFSVEASNPKGKICSVGYVSYELIASVPSVSVSSPSVSIVNATTDVDFTVTYTGADDVELLDSDIFMSTTGTATCATKTVAGGTTSIPIVTLGGCTGEGTLGISIGADTATNVAGSSLASNLSSTFTVDNTGMTAATYSVATGTYDSVPTSVIVTFPETIAGATLSAADFLITGTCSVLSNLSITSMTSTTATIALTAATCATGETMTVSLDLTAFNDAAGNPGVGTADAVYTVDFMGPTSATYLPVASNVNAIPATVDVTFNENVEVASLSDGSFAVTGTCSPLPTATLGGVTGSTATVNLSGGTCTNTQTIIITIDLTTVNDVNGNPGSSTTSVTYTFDDVGPIPTAISPVTGTLAAIPTSVVVTFDEAVLIGSVDSTDLVLTGTCAIPPTVALSSVASGTTMSFDLLGADCATGETVVVTLNGSSITDSAGNIGTGSASVTYTVDETGPTVASFVQPSRPVSTLPASVLINFDEPVDTATVSSTDASGAGSCGTLPTMTDGVVNSTDFTINLSGASCLNGDTFTLTFQHSMITDVAGNAGVGSSAVTYTIDTVAPTVSSFVPAAGTMVVPTSVDIQFSENIDPASVVTGDFGTGGSTCTGISFTSVSVVGSTVTLGVAASCISGQILEIAFNPSSMNDLAGNAGSAGLSSVSYTQP